MSKSSLDNDDYSEDPDVYDKETISFFTHSLNSPKGETMETDSSVSPSKSSTSAFINDESTLLKNEVGPNTSVISEDDCSSDNYEESVLRYLADKQINLCGTSGSTYTISAEPVPTDVNLQSQNSCKTGVPADVMTQQLQQCSLMLDSEEEDCDSDLYEQRVNAYLSELIAATEKVKMSESHFVDGIENLVGRLSLPERKCNEEKCVVTKSDSVVDHGGSNMLTSTTNSQCNLVNLNHDDRLVGVMSAPVVRNRKKITISLSSSSISSSSEKDLKDDVGDCGTNPVRDEYRSSPISSPLHITVSSSPPAMESDVEDSDEYEDMVRKYLMSSFSVPNSDDKDVSQNVDTACGINVTNRVGDSCSSDSNEDNDSGGYISEESDFFPEPRKRKKTLHKKRLWKSLELEMLNDLREEEIEKKKLKRALNLSNQKDFNISGDRDYSSGDQGTAQVWMYNRKFSSKKSRVSGIIKMDDEFYRYLINTDNKEKVTVFNKRDSTVANGSSRNDFFKEIQTSCMQSTLRKINKDALDKDQDLHINQRFSYVFCDICSLKFTNFDQLDRHMVRVHEGKITDICKKCGLSFCSEMDYIEHFTESHGSIMSRISCYLCNQIYDDFDREFMKHLKRDHTFLDLYSFKCRKCNIKFANKFMLNEHLSNDCYFCLICRAYTAKNMQTYRNHLLRHYKVSTYKCEYCDKTFAAQKGCKYHIEKCHLGNLVHICDICDKKFVTRYKLNEHIDRCHNNKGYECDVCRKIFKTICSLNVHKKFHHPVVNEFHCDIDDFTCDSCGVNFNRKQLIIDHFNVINCKCPWCNLSLPCLSKLVEHVEVHRTKSGDKLRCPHCGYEVNNLQNYKRHLTMDHQDICAKENPNAVVCERCLRVCSGRHQLKKHQRLSCMRTEYLLHRGQINETGSNSIDVTSDGTGICQFCDETFDNSKLKKKHFHVKFTTCLKCNCKFVCKTKLDEHVLSVHGQSNAGNLFHETRNIDGSGDTDFFKSISERFLYACKNCGNKYLTRNELLLHEKRLCCKNSDTFLYECEFCKNRYKTCVALSNHNKTCNKFSCIHCKGIFYLKQAFDLHFLLCNNCIFCDESFECCNLFVRHIKSVHSDQIMKFDCLDCHNKFSSIFNLIEHFVLVHNFNQNAIKKLHRIFFVSLSPKMLNSHGDGTNNFDQELNFGLNQCNNIKTVHEISSVGNSFNCLNSINDDDNVLIDEISNDEQLISKRNVVVSECDSTVVTQ